MVLILTLALFLFGLDKAGLLAAPRGLVGGALTPLQVGWDRLSQGVSEKFQIVTEIGSLSSDNLKLREENDRLKAESAALGEVQKDNQLLKSQLSNSETKGYQLLPAQTLGFLPTLGTKQLVLGVGSSSGVKVGQVAILGKVVLGKIASVQEDRSTLRLLTDPNSKVVAVTSAGAKGVLLGQFQSSMTLTKILQSESLNVGDVVFTSGEEDWPARLPVGEVTKVAKQDNELFQEAEIRPLASYDKLQLIFVILGLK